LRAVKEALARVDLILITGGLGPTLDDLTRDVLADAAGVELILDEPSLQHVRDMFANRNRVMPERNVVQAMFPRGSEVIPNPRGTAPGIWMEFPRPENRPVIVAAMPGVPSEMKPMWQNHVLPRLLQAGFGGGKVIRSRRLNIFGLGESQCEEMLGDLTARGRDPEVGITVHEATITLRIEAHGATTADCEAKIDASRQTARQLLGSYLFSEEDDELSDVILSQLQARNETLCVVEDATGGQALKWLATEAGSEAQLRGGLVGSADRLAQSLGLSANVPFIDLVEHWRQQTGSTYAIGIGPQIIPPQTNPAHEPIPTVTVVVTSAGSQLSTTLNTLADVAIHRPRTAKSALNQLRLLLLKLNDPANG